MEVPKIPDERNSSSVKFVLLNLRTVFLSGFFLYEILEIRYHHQFLFVRKFNFFVKINGNNQIFYILHIQKIQRVP